MPADRVKVQFDLEPNDGHGYETETLWAEALGGARFRILNSPFFAFGISSEDVVKADPHGTQYRFQEVAYRGGHSTYRLFLQHNLTIHDDGFKQHWHGLAAQHCTFENANDSLVAVDVPPEADVTEVYRLLERGEADGIWAFEEVHYAGGRAGGRPG